MESTHTKVRVIQTTKGQLNTETQIQSITTILFHQHLTPKIHKVPCNLPLTLENYRYHLAHPLSLENTSLTPGLIDHQLQRLVQLKKCLPSQIMILDGSNYHAKVNQLFDKYVVVKGYNYKLESDQEKGVLLSYDHIVKQIDYQFKLGNGKFKPGFIGDIPLAQCLNGNKYFQAFRGYLTFSDKTKCPILINCIELGEEPAEVITDKDSVSRNQSIKRIEDKLRQVEAIIQSSKDYPNSRLVIYNLSLLFQKTINSAHYRQQINCLTHQKLVSLLNHQQIWLGFDLAAYARSQFTLAYLALIAQTYANRLIFSGGMRYKTDLSDFGGDGFVSSAGVVGSSSVLEAIRQVVDVGVLQQVITRNQLQLLDWKQKWEALQVVTMWECSKCGLSQSEKVQSFRKFGKHFCSIKCLKSFNF